MKRFKDISGEKWPLSAILFLLLIMLVGTLQFCTSPKVFITPSFPNAIYLFQDKLLTLEYVIGETVIDCVDLEVGDKLEVVFVLENKKKDSYCVFRMYDPSENIVASTLALGDCGFIFVAVQEGEYELVYILQDGLNPISLVLNMIRYPIIPVWSK